MKKALVVFLALSFQNTFAQGTNPFIKSGPIGQPPKAQGQNSGCALKDRDWLLVKCWKGEEVLFLPQSKELQFYGYQSFYYPNDEYRNAIPYGVLAGKTGTVQKITSTEEFPVPHIEIRLSDGKTIVAGDAVGGQLDNIAFMRDLKSARKALLGKTVWTKDTGLSTVDADGGNFGFVNTGRLAKITIIDVIAGNSNQFPVRIIAKAPDGKIGYEDVAWSKTNGASTLYDLFSFEANFFTVDPKTLYNFTEQQWQAIKKSKVTIGMPPAAVALAWGRLPDKVNKTTTKGLATEQWVYNWTKSTAYVYFTGGKVSAVQE